jgi:hypothetical protein
MGDNMDEATFNEKVFNARQTDQAKRWIEYAVGVGIIDMLEFAVWIEHVMAMKIKTEY